jgi:hypothetical protein
MHLFDPQGRERALHLLVGPPLAKGATRSRPLTVDALGRSHDLGGHTAPSPPELYTRWVQWGAFSPIFRTHWFVPHILRLPITPP